jgi:hypothetical protein
MAVEVWRQALIVVGVLLLLGFSCCWGSHFFIVVSSSLPVRDCQHPHTLSLLLIPVVQSLLSDTPPYNGCRSMAASVDCCWGSLVGGVLTFCPSILHRVVSSSCWLLPAPTSIVIPVDPFRWVPVGTHFPLRANTTKLDSFCPE